MRINSKMLALLSAVVIGTGLAACQRGDNGKSAQNSSSMDQAPKQGYTGPASPSTSPPTSAPSSSSGGSDTSGAQTGSSGGSQTGSPGSTNPSESQRQPGQDPTQQR